MRHVVGEWRIVVLKIELSRQDVYIAGGYWLASFFCQKPFKCPRSYASNCLLLLRCMDFKPEGQLLTDENGLLVCPLIRFCTCSILYCCICGFLHLCIYRLLYSCTYRFLYFCLYRFMLLCSCRCLY